MKRKTKKETKKEDRPLGQAKKFEVDSSGLVTINVHAVRK